MAIDASIYSQLLQPVKSVDDYKAESQNKQLNALTLLLKQQQVQQGQGTLQDAQRQRELQQRLQSGLQGLGAGASDDQRIGVYEGLGMYDAADKIRKSVADRGKTDAETQTKQLEAAKQRVELTGNVMNWVRQNPTAENAFLAIDHLTQNGVLPADQAAAYKQQIQADPSKVASLSEMAYRSALSAKDQLSKFETRNTGGTTDTLAIDPVTGATRVANTVRNTQSPDNAATNARIAADAAAARKQAERHFQAGQSTPQYMETDAGLVALPKKLAPGQSPVGVPVMGSNGQPLGKPAKDVPPAVAGKIIESKQSLSNIDKAIQAVKSNPDAFGLLNALPGVERMRQGDQKGVEARAQVANIGSLTLHDRSGAAVSASEFPRLAPFIPSSSDNAEAIVTKLSQMKRIAEEELGLYSERYGPGTGYKSPGAAPAKSASTPGGVVDFGSLK